MASKVTPDFVDEIKKYGAVHIEDCINCGNCTAICSLSTEETPLPRTSLRYLQVGLKDKMLGSLEPWLCYYCGECTQTCPKSADPAETMMSIRRWLIAQYDRSGHGAKLYTSAKAAWRSVFFYALVPLVLIIIGHVLGALGVRPFDQLAIVTDQVELNRFAPVLWVWIIVLIDFAFLGYRLFSNIRTMHKLVMKPDENKIPQGVYINELKTLAVHAFTQKRWRDCRDDDKSRWLKHLILVAGYGTMLVLIVSLLWWFQTDNLYPIYHPQRWVGYLATVFLLFTSGEALIGRIRQKDEMHKHSHHSDWMFPAFLFFGSLTGIFVNIFRYAGWPWPTYIMYVVHMMVMVPMLETEVGIGKWTHIFYRPLAIFFQQVKEKAAQQEFAASPAPASD